MSVEDYPLTPEALLAGMKAGVLAESGGLLSFMDLAGGGRDVRITYPGIYPGPWSTHTLYLSILGSPETELTEQRDVYAQHYGVIDAVIPVLELGDERHMVGSAETVGITGFVRRVLRFFNSNFLGLTGIEPGVPPVCYAPRDAYEPIPGGDEQGTLLLTGRMLYSVQTRPFKRA